MNRSGCTTRARRSRRRKLCESVSNSSNLTNLKRVIVTRAHADLRRVNPHYVAAFQNRMAQTQDNLEEAIAAAEPLRGDGLPNWSVLITLLFDMDALALKVNESLRRLRAAREAADFESFEYHQDHWIFQFDAYLERCKRALMKSVRQLLKGSPRKASVEASVRADLDQMRNAIEKMRDELAHGTWDGVDATTPFWVPFLAMTDPLPFDEIFVAATQQAREVRTETRRTQMHLAVVDYCSAGAFARIESLARTILDNLPDEA